MKLDNEAVDTLGLFKDTTTLISGLPMEVYKDKENNTYADCDRYGNPLDSEHLITVFNPVGRSVRVDKVMLLDAEYLKGFLDRAFND